MTISWAALEQMAKGRRPIPLGCTLEYEFRPSLRWIPDIHRVHAFWQANSPNEGCFRHLSKAEQNEWEEKYLQAKYREYKGRAAIDCAWQQFTLTSKEQKLILRMDRHQRVTQMRDAQVTVNVLVPA